MKSIMFFTLLNCSFVVNASNSINCLFTEFHLVNHISKDLSGYTKIDQSLSIVDLNTSKETLSLDGSKRAVNSQIWTILESNHFQSSVTTYIGDFAEILTIEHNLDENKKGLNGWYAATIINSNVATTTTRIGKCLVK